jgi:hypothetical protein
MIINSAGAPDARVGARAPRDVPAARFPGYRTDARVCRHERAGPP